MEINDFAISGSYLIKDILTPDDIIIVKLVNNHTNPQRIQPRTINIHPDPLMVQNKKCDNVPIDVNKYDVHKQDINWNQEQKQIVNQINDNHVIPLVEPDVNDEKDDEKNNVFQQSHNDLMEIKRFCDKWFKSKGDTEHLLLGELTLELSNSVIYCKQINNLKSTIWCSSPNYPWNLQLFLALGYQQDIDPHTWINFTINSYQIQWRNYLVFDNENNIRLTNFVKQSLLNDINFYKYGMAPLTDEYFEKEKDNYMNAPIYASDGKHLVDHPSSAWNYLIRNIRLTQLRIYGFSSKQKAIAFTKTSRFKSSVTRDKTYGYTIDHHLWLEYCSANRILPTSLVKTWCVETENIMKKKEFNKMMRDILLLPGGDMVQWRKQKNGYYRAYNDNHNNISAENVFPIYWKSCQVYNKYIAKYPASLNGHLCDSFVELYLHDCVNGFDLRSGKPFEMNLVDKFRLIISLINLQNENNNIKLLDEDTMKKMNEKKRKINNKINCNIPTPDILFTEDIVINNKKIKWIDAKNYYISSNDPILFKTFIKSVNKYTDAFGCGAIICRGFEQNINQHKSIIKCDVLLLDGSCAIS